MPWGKERFEVSVLSSWGQRTDLTLTPEVLPGPLWCPSVKISLSMERKILKYLQAGIGWPSQNLALVSPQGPSPEYSEIYFSKLHLQEGIMGSYGVFGLLCN